MSNNPNPNCDKECRFSVGYGCRTDVYYPPVYDKHGNNINPDGNISTSTMSCSTCGKSWKCSTQLGETTFTEIK